MATFTAGSVLVMWLGEQITERGIGNGISLIIFCGIVVGIPRGIIQSVALIQAGDMSIFMAIVIVVLMAAVTVAIVVRGALTEKNPHQLRQASGWGVKCTVVRTRTCLCV